VADTWAGDRAAMTHLGAMITPRSYARINTAAITANVAELRRRTPAAIMATVKADGYGHGLLPAARAALAGGAEWLAVAFLEEALALRDGGIEAPVLSLIATPQDQLHGALAAGIDLTVGASWLLAEVVAAVKKTGRRARIHLEVDTGLSRGGATAEAWPGLLDEVTGAADAVEVIGIWSHLACSDEPKHPANDAQLTAFNDALAIAKQRGIVPQLRHLANSGGLLALPETHFDAVRPGIAIYGVAPGPDIDMTGLTPAMTLISHVAKTKQIAAGTGVSYGLTHVVDRDTRIALVPLGYGDGIPRHASNVGEVLIGGRRRPIVGRVCMDQFLVSTGDDRVSAGDEVILFGPGDNGEPTAYEWGEAIGSIGYEIVTRVGSRVPRVYEP
jgi:alanine racemase